MKLKISQINELKEAISGLEGTQEVHDGKVITKPFKLSGKTRWNLSKNLAILSRKMEGYEKVKNDLLLQISGGSGIIKEAEVEKIAEFTKQVREIITTEEEVDGLLKIKEEELKLDENPIPLAVLSSLSLLIE
jgi:hypothetical protein